MPVSHLPAWSNCHFFDCLRVAKLWQAAGKCCGGKSGAGLSAVGSGTARLEAVEQSGKGLRAVPCMEPNKG